MTNRVQEKFGELARYVLLVIVVLDSLLVFASYKNTQAVTRNMQNNVIEEQVFSDLKDAECGQRGYLYTDGDDSYLPQYYVGVASTKADMLVLREYLSNQPDTDTVVKQLDKEVNIKLKELDSTVRAYRSGDPETAKSIVKSNNGLEDMDRVRTLIGVLRAQERDQLRHRRFYFF